MGYSKKTYAKVQRILKERRQMAERTVAQHKAEFANKCPEVLKIEREMAQTALSAIKTVGSGQDVAEIIPNLAARNLELQEERKELLQKNGFPENYLMPQYVCPICEDKGYVDGKTCVCYEKLLKEQAYAQLAEETPLSLSDFESFTLSLYSNQPDENGLIPREEMKGIYQFCKGYAENFSLESDSLFLYGKTGLGKTHLSLAIAAKAINKGFGVIYGSAQNLLSKLESERFGRTENEDTESLLLNCDLLILDDLGTEFTTGYTVSEIYNIINTRGLRRKPTIINSNLDFSELQKKYTDRITSRILGNYTVLHFCGGDIRIALR